MSACTSSVFGNVHLGYVVIETQKFGDWKRFARDAIGMHIDELDADAMRFRLDANECRALLPMKNKKRRFGEKPEPGADRHVIFATEI